MLHTFLWFILLRYVGLHPSPSFVLSSFCPSCIFSTPCRFSSPFCSVPFRRSFWQPQLFLFLRCWNDKQLGRSFNVHIMFTLLIRRHFHYPSWPYGELVSRYGTYNRSSQALLSNWSLHLTTKLSKVMWLHEDSLASHESSFFFFFFALTVTTHQ